MAENQFDWVEFYKEFAHKLLEYKNNRNELIKKVNELNEFLKTLSNNNTTAKLELDGVIDDIDPFTIFGIFNKQRNDVNRLRIIKRIKEIFSISANLPTNLHGIPTLNNQNATYYLFKDKREEDDINILWNLFESAIKFSDKNDEKNYNELKKDFNLAFKLKGNKTSKITCGLFWIASDSFLNLDKTNRNYIYNSNIFPEKIKKELPNKVAIEDYVSFDDYYLLVKTISSYLKERSKDFRQFSYDAWQYSEKNKKEKNKINNNNDNDNKRYWLYSPGNDAEDWEEHYEKGIIAIGKDAIGDLSVFKSKEEMRKKMQEIINPQKDYTQSAKVSWQFANVIKPGDIVYVRKGLHKIIGRGEVIGDYKFDITRHHHKNIHKIKWTHTGNFDYPDNQASRLTLTELTPNAELVNIIENLFNDKVDNEVKNNNSKIIEKHLNTILYGPPGTGKTYNTVIKAMEIIKGNLYAKIKEEYKKEYDKDKHGDFDCYCYNRIKEEFNKAKKDGFIEFITFHQSYSYEEFIEGIKPIVSNSIECENDEIKNSGEIKYKIDEGIFKRICNKAMTAKFKKDKSINDLIRSDANVWKVTIRDEVKQDCFDNNRVRIDFDFEDKEAKRFNEQIDKGDIILTTSGSRSKINGIAIVDKDEANKLNSSEDQTSRDVIWLVKDIDENIMELNDNKWLQRNTLSRVPSMKASKILEFAISLKDKKDEGLLDNSNPCVLIIDEINRGNISKIFGELITLLEEDKRENFSVRLPYSHEEFTVPKNLYIIGTMNTSDRSIATIDIALRRRFTFKEMMPEVKHIPNKKVFGIELKDIFNKLNKRICVLLDRDHQIGHSYFMKLDGYSDEKMINEEFQKIWFNDIMPLLNEYFYNDWEKLQALLGKAAKSKANGCPSFIKEIEDVEFANSEYDCDKENQYDFANVDDVLFEEAMKNAFKDQIQTEKKENE